jgi:RNA polymerase sigma-70 factor, ECF subfamily
MSVSRLDFPQLYEEFHGRISRYLSRLVGESDAEDLTQEVFLKISQGLPAFRGEAQLSTWVYRIATNTAIDKMRTPAFSRETAVADLDEGLCDPVTDPLPDQEVMRREMYDCFGKFVKALPASYRAIVILSELEELSNREIADILELSLDAVKIRLHRGRSLLFEQLKSHCKAEDWL